MMRAPNFDTDSVTHSGTASHGETRDGKNDDDNKPAHMNSGAGDRKNKNPLSLGQHPEVVIVSPSLGGVRGSPPQYMVHELLHQTRGWAFAPAMTLL